MLLIDTKARITGVYNATETKDIERIVCNIKTLFNNKRNTQIKKIYITGYAFKF